jgi:hypothetical protein
LRADLTPPLTGGFYFVTVTITNKGKRMKTNLDQFFKTSEDLEKNGIWFEISDSIGFLLRPFKSSNPRVKAAIASYYKPYARQIEMGTLEPAKQQEIQAKVFVDVCLIDWKGIEIDGKAVELDKAVAVKFFVSLPDLFDTLWKHVSDFNNYKEDLGNS